MLRAKSSKCSKWGESGVQKSLIASPPLRSLGQATVVKLLTEQSLKVRSTIRSQWDNCRTLPDRLFWMPGTKSPKSSATNGIILALLSETSLRRIPLLHFCLPSSGCNSVHKPQNSHNTPTTLPQHLSLLTTRNHSLLLTRRSLQPPTHRKTTSHNRKHALKSKPARSSETQVNVIPVAVSGNPPSSKREQHQLTPSTSTVPLQRSKDCRPSQCRPPDQMYVSTPRIQLAPVHFNRACGTE